MIEKPIIFPERIAAGMLADYRFCLYRLEVLKRNPVADRASIDAVAGRMNQLVHLSLSGAQIQKPQGLSGYRAETAPNNTVCDNGCWHGLNAA